MTGTGVYLYGIGRGLDPEVLADVSGVAGSPVRLLDEEGLTGVVSTVPLSDFGEEGLRRHLEDLRWVETVARAHNAVVERCFPAGAIAPVSLATVCFDDASVRSRIRRWHDEVDQVLERVHGRSEVGVKAFGTPALPANEPARVAPAAAGGEGAGAAYLRRRQAETDRSRALSERAAEVAATLHTELAGHSAASRRHPPQDPRLTGRPDMLLNGAYLVDDVALEDFARLVHEAAARWPGVEVELTGPWPPYSFVTLDPA